MPGSNPIRNREWNETVTKAADSFWSAFQMTENGKVKSTLLLYSFCLCCVFIAVYAGAYILLLDPLHAWVSGAPGWMVYTVESLVPAAAGALVCALPWPLLKDKRIIPASYTWMLALGAACLAAMLVIMRDEPEARGLFVQFFLQAVPAPVVLGGGFSGLLYRRWRKRLWEKQEMEPMEPWKKT